MAKADLLGGLRWLEVGSGAAPMPGYCHLDLNPGAPHLEIHADASNIPLDDGSVDRLLSIHLLEHFHQYDVLRVLCEWWRVLTPGGEIEVHTPDFAIVSAAFLAEQDIGRKMELAHTILGLYDHKTIFDEMLLSGCLRAVGFVDVARLDAEDRHDVGWKHLLPDGWSLKLIGRKPT